MVLLIVLGGMGARSYVQASRLRRAETVDVPQAAQLLENSRPLAALKKLREVEKYAPSSLALIRLKEEIVTLPSTINTTPQGAEIYATDYADPRPPTLPTGNTWAAHQSRRINFLATGSAGYE